MNFATLDLLSLLDFDGLPLPADAIPGGEVPFTVLGAGASVAQARGTWRRYGLDLLDPASGLQLVNAFTAATPTRALIWPGDDAAALATPATSWAVAEDGQLFLDLAPADLAGLEAQFYPLRVETARGGAWTVAWSGWVDVQPEPAAGLLPRVYCGYRDLTAIGGAALGQLRSLDEGAGFLRARAEAREWLDSVILARHRPAGSGLAFNGLTGSPVAADAPDPWLEAQLAAGKLRITPTVREVAVAKSLACLFGRQMDADYQRRSAACHRAANSLVAGLVARVGADANGYGGITINCGVMSMRSI